jgi:hypothetical protein
LVESGESEESEGEGKRMMVRVIEREGGLTYG